MTGVQTCALPILTSLAGLVCGLLVGRAFYMPVGGFFVKMFKLSVEASHITAFILILILVPLLFSLVGWLLSKLLSAISLGWVNRLLGGAVGVIKFALLAGVIITGIELFDKHDTLLPEEHKEDSVLYYPIYDATGIFFDGIKEELNGLES